ncbi:hypothetical protein K432DRAFT_307482, partial [Lepidopterella palustris CBS 459.81]
GVIRATKRLVQGIPPCIWIKNQHTGEITVIASKFKSNRLLTSRGLQESAQDGGLNLEATVMVYSINV